MGVWNERCERMTSPVTGDNLLVRRKPLPGL